MGKVRHDRNQRMMILENLKVYEAEPGRFAISNGTVHKFLPHTFAQWTLEVFWDYENLG